MFLNTLKKFSIVNLKYLQNDSRRNGNYVVNNAAKKDHKRCFDQYLIENVITRHSRNDTFHDISVALICLKIHKYR